MAEKHQTIRVLIADPQPLLREAVRCVASKQSDIEVAGEAASGGETLEKARQLEPDVIVMELRLPEKDGFEVIQEIGAGDFSGQILVLTGQAENDTVFRAIQAGALGCLLKESTTPDELCRAIRSVSAGQHALSSAVASKLVHEFAETPGKSKYQVSKREGAASSPLTRRELAVLRLMAHGMSNRDISKNLKISEATVRAHASCVLAKLHLENRTKAAIYALQQGIVTLDSIHLE